MQKQAQLRVFLGKENDILKDELQELRHLLTLNKQALSICGRQKSSRAETEALWPQLVTLLYEQNKRLLDSNAGLRKELESKLCQALISDQIAVQYADNEQVLTEELRQQLVSLKREIEKRDLFILQMQSRGLEGNTKVVEISNMTTVSAKLHDTIQSLRMDIERGRQQFLELRYQKEEVDRLNILFLKQLNEFKESSTMRKSTVESRGLLGTQKDIIEYLEYQRNHFDSDNDDASGSFSDEDQNEDQLSEESDELEPQIVDPAIKQAEGRSKFINSIPALRLSETKSIHAGIIQKLNKELSKKSGKDDKYAKYQAQIDNLKKKIGGITLEKIAVERENQLLRRMIGELQGRNEVLTKAVADVSMKRNYEQRRQSFEDLQMETIIDICRDVTLNKRLREVIRGQLTLQCRQIISAQV